MWNFASHDFPKHVGDNSPTNRKNGIKIYQRACTFIEKSGSYDTAAIK
jgi:hypothetical protein